MENEEGETDTSGEEIKKTSDGDKFYSLMCLIKDYSDFTHIDFDRTWEKEVAEFFNTIAFIKEYKRREQEAIKKLQSKLKLN